MADAKVPHQGWGVGRLGIAAAWVAAVCCLPYLVLKVVWTVGVPMGITDRSVLDSNEWVAGNSLMAVIQLVGLLLVLALTRAWARRLPTWLLLLPVWVGTGLLFQVAVGAVLGLFSLQSAASGGSTAGIRPWVFVMVYGAFAGQGAALGVAFVCHVRARWDWLLGERTGEVVTRGITRGRSWPERHFKGIVEAVAGLAAAIAVVFCYWAAGGSLGLSGNPPHPSWALQASRVVGAVTALIGLLGLAGRWGRRGRFWWPAALTWVGSGALAAFDGLTTLLNRLFLLLGADVSVSGWSMIDTALVIKVAIGMLAACVGTVALAAAARGTEVPSRPGRDAPTLPSMETRIAPRVPPITP